MSPDVDRVETARLGERTFHCFKIGLEVETPLDTELFDTQLLEVGKWYGERNSGLARARFVVSSKTNTMVVFSPYDDGKVAPEMPVTLERALTAFGYEGTEIAGFGEVLITRNKGRTGIRYITANFLRPSAGEISPSLDQIIYVFTTLVGKLGGNNFNFSYVDEAQDIVNAFNDWMSGLT
jgi:hypothetical protein